MHYEIGIVGGGAAGLMSAISAAKTGCKSIAIFESNVRCGTKILMSGGTRCNITNQSVKPEHFFGGNKNFIKNVFKAFGDKQTVDFFQSTGVELKVEPGGKYFPKNDSAKTVLNSLLHLIESFHIKIFYSTKISDVERINSKFILKSNNDNFVVDKLILTTGGKSYPSTGSDGTGYNLAIKLGHSLLNPLPALTPIILNEPKLTALSGITINAALMIYTAGKKHIETENSLLFTHVGISGPAALNISREFVRLQNEDMNLFINFIPALNNDNFPSKLKEQARLNPNKTVISFLREMIPLKLSQALMEISGIDSEKKFYSLRGNEIKNLTEVVTKYNLCFSGVKGFSQAEVTAGGIPLNEVRFQTMESKIQKGLYIAGEILDVDGIIGGYNFQWAWSTGSIAGRSAAVRS